MYLDHTIISTFKKDMYFLDLCTKYITLGKKVGGIIVMYQNSFTMLCKFTFEEHL